MQPETVYNSFQNIPDEPDRAGYLGSIGEAARGRQRTCTLAIAVAAVICTLLGAALVLYGSVFHHHYTSAPLADVTAEQRHAELRLYRALLGVGVPLLLAAGAMWAVYLHRTGRCRHCWLCPGARRRRRLRNHFQTQCLEAGNLSVSCTGRPVHHPHSQERDRLVGPSSAPADPAGGFEDTDAMLDKGPKPAIRSAKRDI